MNPDKWLQTEQKIQKLKDFYSVVKFVNPAQAKYVKLEIEELKIKSKEYSVQNKPN